MRKFYSLFFIVISNFIYSQISVTNDSDKEINKLYLISENEKCTYNFNKREDFQKLNKPLAPNEKIDFKNLDTSQKYTLIFYDSNNVFRKHISNGTFKITQFDKEPSFASMTYPGKITLSVNNDSEYDIISLKASFENRNKSAYNFFDNNFEKLCAKNNKTYEHRVSSKNKDIRYLFITAVKGNDTLSKKYSYINTPDSIDFKPVPFKLEDNTLFDVEFNNTLTEYIKNKNYEEAYQLFKMNMGNGFVIKPKDAEEFEFSHAILNFFYGNISSYKPKVSEIKISQDAKLLTLYYDIEYNSKVISQAEYRYTVEYNNEIINFRHYQPANTLQTPVAKLDKINKDVLRNIKAKKLENLAELLKGIYSNVDEHLIELNKTDLSNLKFSHYTLNANYDHTLQFVYIINEFQKLKISYTIPEDYTKLSEYKLKQISYW